MTTADADIPPPVVDQDDPAGVWRAHQLRPNLAEMVWEPAEDGGVPEGHLRDQPHDIGAWWAGPGDSMTWQPSDPAPAPVESSKG